MPSTWMLRTRSNLDGNGNRQECEDAGRCKELKLAPRIVLQGRRIGDDGNYVEV